MLSVMQEYEANAAPPQTKDNKKPLGDDPLLDGMFNFNVGSCGNMTVADGDAYMSNARMEALYATIMLTSLSAMNVSTRDPQAFYGNPDAGSGKVTGDDYASYYNKTTTLQPTNQTGLVEGIGKSLSYKPTSGATLTATPGKTTTILGRYGDDTRFILDELQLPKSTDFSGKSGGFNLLNTPDELYVNPQQFWIEYNKPWLDNAINRADDILLATKPTVDKLFLPGTTELTGFGREYRYLVENGYNYNESFGKMIKP